MFNQLRLVRQYRLLKLDRLQNRIWALRHKLGIHFNWPLSVAADYYKAYQNLKLADAGYVFSGVTKLSAEDRAALLEVPVLDGKALADRLQGLLTISRPGYFRGEMEAIVFTEDYEAYRVRQPAYVFQSLFGLYFEFGPIEALACVRPVASVLMMADGTKLARQYFGLTELIAGDSLNISFNLEPSWTSSPVDGSETPSS